jgi:hypothetical protein
MEAAMGKYLFQVSYTAQGAKGLLEGGGGKRRASAEQAATVFTWSICEPKHP